MINYHIPNHSYSNKYDTPESLTDWISKIDHNYLSGFWHVLVIL